MDCNATTDIKHYVVGLSTASCLLSVFGALAIFATFFFVKEVRNSTRIFVMSLTLADLLSAAGYLVSSIAYYFDRLDKVCLPQSIITTFTSLVSFFLTVVIAIHIFVSVVSGSHKTSSTTFLILSNIISWMVPACIVCIAVFEKVLGETSAQGTGPWCWVKSECLIDKNKARLWRFLAGKGWEFQCYLYTVSLYVLLRFYLYLRQRHRSLHDINSQLREEDRNLLYVWFILYLLRFWGSVRFIISDLQWDKTSEGNKLSTYLLPLQAVGDPAQAFGNFILFCVLDKTVRTTFVNKFFNQNVCCLTSVAEGDERASLMPHGESRCKDISSKTNDKQLRQFVAAVPGYGTTSDISHDNNDVVSVHRQSFRDTDARDCPYGREMNKLES